jgi:hypothetical protein
VGQRDQVDAVGQLGHRPPHGSCPGVRGEVILPTEAANATKTDPVSAGIAGRGHTYADEPRRPCRAAENRPPPARPAGQSSAGGGGTDPGTR